MSITAATVITGISKSANSALALYSWASGIAAALFGILWIALVRGSRQDVYNILWAVVFGFATLNILSLAARRMEPSKRGLSFGEFMAVMVVLMSVILLGWEMLNVFHIFPIRLHH